MFYKKENQKNDAVYIVREAVKRGFVGDLFTVYIGEDRVRYLRLSKELLEFTEVKQ